MADISAKITRKSLAAKKRSAIKAVRAESREKIREIRIQYAGNPGRTQARAAEAEQRRLLRAQRKNARLAYTTRQPRRFSLGEELFNSISHGIGAGLSVAAIVLLVVHACIHAPRQALVPAVVGAALFGGTLFMAYMMSTLYHALVPLRAKKVFAILNHVAIYLLIAGTYSPFALIAMQGTAGLRALCAVWAAAAVLGTLYAALGVRMRSFCVASYLLLGWLLAATLPLTGTEVPPVSRTLLLAGGLAYTAGFVSYLMQQHKWTHSVFHTCAVAGSVLHFFAVFFLI